MSEPVSPSPHRKLAVTIGWASFGVFLVGAGAGNVWASAVAVIALCLMGYGIARLTVPRA
ncbi:MAG: hypothetical protein ACKO3A_06920 [Opitutia bacterium]